MPTSPTGEGRGARGFTLLETLAALAVIAVIAMLAQPQLRNAAPGFALRAAAESFQADLRRARAAALREMRDATLTVDLGRGVWIDDASGRTGAFPPEAGLTLVTARQERLADDLGRIRFFADGGSTGGEVVIRRGGDAVEVSVDWLDGRTRVTDVADR